MDKISIITPCFNEFDSLPIFYSAIKEVTLHMKEQNFEFIFIDDGSKDNTLNIIKNFSEHDSRIKFISFSRNFGKESAMYAGLINATGDYIAFMDADMQDPPSLLPEMYRYISSGEYDSVATRRTTREGEPPIRSFFARMFYKIINKLSKSDIVDGARDFRLMNRKMVDAIISIGEYNRFSKGIFGWVGFRTKWLPYVNVKRAAGETKWSFWKLFLYSLEGIVAFTTAPLAIASIIGFLLCFLSLALLCVIVVKTLLWGDPVSGWPSMTCIILLIGGIQLFSIGILGQYLAKTYIETKKRPLFIVNEDNINVNKEK
ncbi:glycosyltransferase family 2 protein [Anaeromicropila herbilytica]|uniref:Glycosyl transferase family 2 n=1 Tax=Anaeromicropila herbilytica TaxID=2785025 RepID=A0A7R7IEN8_9FIRM|nr:glycosyltransferase family 2 protein [Anaeromicropila herbilytica]BCN32211.1 glycosyl transferase family 2 [Anaeromicropila herbilytica]